MASAHYDRSLEEIDKTISDISRKLVSRTEEEQATILSEDKDVITELIKLLIRERMPLFGKTRIGKAVATVVSSVTSFFGFDPLFWHCFKEGVHNAKLANRISSDWNLVNFFDDIGKRLEDHPNAPNVKPYWSSWAKLMEEEVTSTAQVTELAEKIIACCKKIHFDFTEIVLDPNDVKIVLSGIIKAVLNSANCEHSVDEQYAAPVIVPRGYGWVKYRFLSNSHVINSCCSKQKFIRLEIKRVSFLFPSEDLLHAALKDIGQ